MYPEVSCPSRLLYSIYTGREAQCNTTNNSQPFYRILLLQQWHEPGQYNCCCHMCRFHLHLSLECLYICSAKLRRSSRSCVHGRRTPNPPTHPKTNNCHSSLVISTFDQIRQPLLFTTNNVTRYIILFDLNFYLKFESTLGSIPPCEEYIGLCARGPR
jgi:hypothetical protein